MEREERFNLTEEEVATVVFSVRLITDRTDTQLPQMYLQYRRDMFWIECYVPLPDSPNVIKLGALCVVPDPKIATKFTIEQNWCLVERGLGQLITRARKWFLKPTNTGSNVNGMLL